LALAVAADIVPFRLPPPARRTTTFLLSPAFCFSILMLYPPANGVIAQLLAIAVAAPRLHLRWPSLAFLTARLVCSFAAAGWAADVLRGPTQQVKYIPGPDDIRVAVPVALVFLGVTLVISLVGALLSDATRHEIWGQVRIEVVARCSVLLIGVIIVSTPTLWSHLLLFVPLLGWYQLSRLLARRERQLAHDPESGLLSRLGMAYAVAALPRVHRQDLNWYELIVVELRGLAHIRRSLGQDVAKTATIGAAERLRADSGSADKLGQLSESQFLVLRPEAGDDGGVGGAHRVLASLSEPIDCYGVSHDLDPVAGVAVSPQHGRRFDVLLSNAQAALVEADLSKERARVYTPEVKSEVDDRFTLLRDLAEVLREPSRASEIAVLYQPQVSLATGQANSVEALLRWTHPDRGPIPTDALIELVEPTGVMQRLTHHVLDRVVAQLAEWNRAGIDLRATVNVSVNDLCFDHFDTQLEDLLQAHDVPARQLDIEITERALVEDTPRLDDATRRVAALGVGLSLDDFGTGHASLRNLRHMPLTEVKIDRSYVSRMVESRADRATVATIHEFANVLGLRVVAEGIEDERTARMLGELGGVIGQGWLYARPMTAQQLESWLHDRETVRMSQRVASSTAAEPELEYVVTRDAKRVHDHGTGVLDVSVATDLDTGTADVTARGTLDLSTAVVLRRALIKAAAEEPSRVLVDLNDTAITDKGAVAVLIALAGRLSESRIGFAVHVRPGDTADLLHRLLLSRFPVRDNRPDAIAALADPVQRHQRLRMHLMPEPTAPAQARQLVDLACVNWGLRVDRDIARLVVSELVTNVVEHAGTDVDVSLVRTRTHLIVQVGDRSTDMPTMAGGSLGSGHLDGWGLALVDATAAGWGIRATDTGKTVWATLQLADDRD
jgi:EAL domain-containing protein (putative c-di-GMP-specific phosphodiesterase class I)/GGDEF domain-containing protein/anti-anti-sigma regulatory factor